MKRIENSGNVAKELNGLAVDVVRDARKNKIVIPIALTGLVIVALIVLFAFLIPLADDVAQTGATIGEGVGFVVGKAVGSAKGATEGYSDGAAAGKSVGLSAEDTIAEISNTMKGIEKLEVLIAKSNLTTYHEKGETYGALYLTRANVVFTIDLNEMQIAHDEKTISVMLPKPKATITIDEAEREKLAEWQKKLANGSDSEGFTAMLNTIPKEKEHSAEELENYDTLLELACDSAIKQITEIANAARGIDSDLSVTVAF